MFTPIFAGRLLGWLIFFRGLLKASPKNRGAIMAARDDVFSDPKWWTIWSPESSKKQSRYWLWKFQRLILVRLFSGKMFVSVWSMHAEWLTFGTFAILCLKVVRTRKVMKIINDHRVTILWPFWDVRDLQRLGMKRSRIESHGSYTLNTRCSFN